MRMRPIKKWALRLGVTVVFIAGLLAGIVLKPSLLYAHSSEVGNFTILHQHKLDPQFVARLINADTLLKSSEIYDSSLKLSVCLNDGSYYPQLVQDIGGRVFGRGFADILVLGGTLHAAQNYVELNGYRWNLTELLAHEAVHCLEFNRYGLLNSNVIGHRHEDWKWEGYPEYVARKRRADLAKNIAHLVATERTDNNNWIFFDDSTGTVIPYYKAWLLVQYSLDIRKLSFDQLLKDTASEQSVTVKMQDWYNKQM